MSESEVRTCVRCGTPVNIIGQCPKCLKKDDPDERFMYRLGERVWLMAKDDRGACGEVIGQDHHELPQGLGGGMEERVNVRLDDGTETGLIPITLVKVLSPRKEATLKALKVEGMGELDGTYDKRPEVEQTHDPVQGLPRKPFSHCPAPERGAYVDPTPKTPETLVDVVRELEDVAGWVKHGSLGSIKMKELRQKVIKAAITINGCASTWEFEREHRPGMREAPMPGSHSSDLHGLRRELESIAYAIDGYLEAKTDRSEKGNILERLEKVVILTSSLQKTWLDDEYALGFQARDLDAFDRERKGPSKHKLLFFGPSVADDRTTKEMARTGTLPESQMDDRINQMMREGWRVVFRHFDPSFHVQQWRIVLEKP